MPLLAFDDFTEAAKKAIEIAEQNTQEPEEAVFGSDIWQESNDTQNINVRIFARLLGMSKADLAQRRMKLSSPLSALLDGHTEVCQQHSDRSEINY